eukprot:1157912-Pelagomonas_calceolata.AAC.5
MQSSSSRHPSSLGVPLPPPPPTLAAAAAVATAGAAPFVEGAPLLVGALLLLLLLLPLLLVEAAPTGALWGGILPSPLGRLTSPGPKGSSSMPAPWHICVHTRVCTQVESQGTSLMPAPCTSACTHNFAPDF